MNPMGVKTNAATWEESFEEIGIALDDVINTAMALWVPHPGVETEARAREVFSSELRRTLADPNVWILLYTGVALERDARQGLIPNLDAVSYEKDLACLIADEVLGMALAMYIGGYKGHFDYTRFDKLKPGVLKSLGPFLDDIVAGLIGGVSANMYDRGAADAATPP
ncbi:MAG TPA: phosphatidylglycerophosphatase A [Candidatus Bathyarchaeia archaeon]|nr:phosphatidylglycerophosphatase A [Candidatus Bathyarchaeia archaeon]